ncbi:MAG: hypothetical protein MK004_22025 [Planctomycetales bacterium]|nr:hypothetical protein [Planctomycetales bacterium]
MNVNVRDGGRLLVEMLDKAGEVMATSRAIKGDHRRGEVTWGQGEIVALKGQPVKLRFTLRETALYSFWIDQ